ncbi:uncharacterized protein [Periplaneta americana]|uniref:uncharacterized protein n=1 Tax=Periplaneta americana TaxID=6978 RepID=UPI0037E98A0D
MYKNTVQLLLVLHVLVIAESISNISIELFRPSWAESELTQGNEDINNIFDEVLSKTSGKNAAHIQPFNIEKLYFHNDEQEFSMLLDKMEGYSKFEFKPVKIRTVLLERRIDMKLLLPDLHVEGFYQCDRMAYGDYNTKGSGYFWLTFKNLTAEGIGILKIDKNNSITVEKMRLSYKPKTQNVEISQHDTSPRLSVFVNSDTFQKTIVKKIWRGITFHMNKAVEDKANAVLKKRSLKKIIGNDKTFAKYQDYVITTTESANKMVDTIIDYAKAMILQKHQDRIKIPNIREGFEKEILFINWKGEFHADKGTARGLHTVERMGETTFASDNSSMMHFYGTLGFEHVDLAYGFYKAHLMGLGPTGTINTKFFPLDLYVHIHIDFTGREVHLDEFKVMSVGDLEVQLGGWGWLVDFLTSKVATWVVGLYRDKIIYDLQNKYSGYITGLLKSYNLDEILEGKILR